MNSKKALKNIRDYHNETVYDTDSIYTENIFEKELDSIEKDLERLEKYERMFEIMKRHFYVCRGFIEGRITTPKNYNEALKHSWTKYYNGMLVTDNDYDELYDLWNDVLKNDK